MVKAGIRPGGTPTYQPGYQLTCPKISLARLTFYPVPKPIIVRYEP
jgi:hypothetical protein